MEKNNIIAKLSNSSSGDLILRLDVPIYLVLVPPHRADCNFNMYTNEEELKEFVKKLLTEKVDFMEIILDNE